MNWLVFHVASGQSFFSGIALVVVAAVASRSSNAVSKRVAVLGFVIGVIAIVISSTPIPYWYYGLASVATVPWIASAYVTKWRPWSAFAVIAAWTIAAIMEIPYHLPPRLGPASSPSVTIIGDSVTAGMGGEDQAETWPVILAKEHGIEIQDNSHVGETAASALKRLKDKPITSSLVIIEIGGNDLLGSTTSAKFSRDLDALLAHVTSSKSQTIMFELPLPPFHHEYGRIQRVLAHKYGVSLIPKRVFLDVLGASGSTLDTIHLSQAGHQRMAECVWALVGIAFAN
jgi:acyl-CoA thioesterase-1